MTPRKQLLLDTTGLIYIRTCRDCDNIYKTCTGSNQNPSITSRYKVPFILTRNLFAMDNSGKGINHFFTNEESLVLFSGIVGKIKNTPWFLFVFVSLLLCFDILHYQFSLLLILIFIYFCAFFLSKGECNGLSCPFKRQIPSQVVVAHNFNPSTWEVKAGGSL